MRRTARSVVAVQDAQDRHRVDRSRIRRAVRATLACEGVQDPVEVSVVLTDDAGIRALNRAYRQEDRATDVLAFPQPGSPERPQPLGDVVISVERAVEQAREAGWSLEEELELLAVHGTLHLLGYEDEDAAARARMEQRQEEILRRLRRRKGRLGPTVP